MNVPAVNVPLLPMFSKLEPPFSIPFEFVHEPVNVCVSPVPRLSVPPFPLIVNPFPFTLFVNVALPPVFVIETVPVVVNPAML